LDCVEVADVGIIGLLGVRNDVALCADEAARRSDRLRDEILMANAQSQEEGVKELKCEMELFRISDFSYDYFFAATKRWI
jgi:hypothetical protein